jgi:hypothetical protein
LAVSRTRLEAARTNRAERSAKLAVAFVLVIALAGVSLLVYLQPPSSGSQLDEPPSSRAESVQRTHRINASIHRVPISLRAHFRIFDSPAEGLPPLVETILRRPLHGSNWSLAQSLAGTPWPVWAVPGQGVLCLLSQERTGGGIGSSCSSIKRAIKYGLFASSLADRATGASRPKRVVIGIVPNGISGVKVFTTGKPARNSLVSHNTFVLRDRVLEPAEQISLLQQLHTE